MGFGHDGTYSDWWMVSRYVEGGTQFPLLPADLAPPIPPDGQGIYFDVAVGRASAGYEWLRDQTLGITLANDVWVVLAQQLEPAGQGTLVFETPW